MGGKSIDVYLQEGGEEEGFKEISFSYEVGHWMTVHKQ